MDPAPKPEPIYTTTTVDISRGLSMTGLTEGVRVETLEKSDADSSPFEDGPPSSLQLSQDLAGDISELSLARNNLDVMQRTKSGIKVSSPHFASNPGSTVSSPLNSLGASRDRDGRLADRIVSGLTTFKRNPAQHRKRFVDAWMMCVTGMVVSRANTLVLDFQRVCDRGCGGDCVWKDDGV